MRVLLKAVPYSAPLLAIRMQEAVRLWLDIPLLETILVKVRAAIP
jgi:hypothetical protein